MILIIWEYQVKAEHVAEFENLYSVHGAWAELFKRSESYLGTELLHDPDQAHRYMTVDRWVSLQKYESFLAQWKTEYAALDAQCGELTESESLVGRWESISTETR